MGCRRPMLFPFVTGVKLARWPGHTYQLGVLLCMPNFQGAVFIPLVEWMNGFLQWSLLQ